ncbi:hypothetical protein D1AOALGA4SA_12329 [Olavius algarvensis Delta 1 endosymbiont]|nr:hypothetical protein D1AOALGA4SA_12329 [Olavius algarvensis Delta 1 endosymbiont]
MEDSGLPLSRRVPDPAFTIRAVFIGGCSQQQRISGVRCRVSGDQNARSSYETTLKANRRITNIEPQNVEGWNRFAQSFLK